ncbi:lysine transporter [Cupriavidus basilensis OR16]|uniref:Lysine transporter n=1 Tax=Cupriavidus basilensis OR16 TaxID=1127483 RepID=H1SAS2_9BURK|nr:lysine transporter [Cupriavidus basilensis OR16]
MSSHPHPHQHPVVEHDDLQRKLKARHLTMIAIGGAVGTGLFVAPDDQPGRARRAYAGGRLLRHLQRAVRGRGLWLRAWLELLVQPRGHDRRGAGGGAASDAVLVPARLRHGVEHGLPAVDVWPQCLLGTRLRRGRVLVRADQGGHDPDLPGGRPDDDLRPHARRPAVRLAQLHAGRCAFRWRHPRHVRRCHDRRVLLPGHGNGRCGRRRSRRPGTHHPARHPPDLLAHPAVLRAGDPDHRCADSLHRPQPATQRRHRHRRQPLRAGVPPRRAGLRCRPDECRGADRPALRRHLQHVRLHPDPLRPGGQRAGATRAGAALRQRRALRRAVRHHRRRRPVLPQFAVWRQGGLPVAAEHVRHDWLYRLARHRHQPLPLSPRAGAPGLQAVRPGLPFTALPVWPHLCHRAVRGNRAGPELPGLLRRARALAGNSRHLYRRAAVPGSLAWLSAGQEDAADRLRGYAVQLQAGSRGGAGCSFTAKALVHRQQCRITRQIHIAAADDDANPLARQR